MRVATICCLTALGAWHAPAIAMDFTSTGEGGSKLIIGFGEVLIGDDAKLHRLVGAMPMGTSISGVVLNSPGGNYVEGVRLANTIRNSHVKTAVWTDGLCASACFLMFAAGSEKYVFDNARVGVHSASDRGSDSLSAQAATTLMARKASEFGVPDAIVGKMVTTSPDSMTWLTRTDLLTMNVSFRSVRKDSVATSDYEPGSALVPGSSRGTEGATSSSVPSNSTSQTTATASLPRPSEEESADFTRGRADRMAFQSWFDVQSGEYLSGASWWAEHRSQAARQHLTCGKNPTPFAEGCLKAQQLLADADRRRLSSPDYKAGWNKPLN